MKKKEEGAEEEEGDGGRWEREGLMGRKPRAEDPPATRSSGGMGGGVPRKVGPWARLPRMSEDLNPEACGLLGVPGLGPSALSSALDRLQLVPLAIPPTQLRSGKHLGLQILPKSWEREGRAGATGSTQSAERTGEAAGRAATGCPLCGRVGLCAAVLPGLCPKSLLA